MADDHSGKARTEYQLTKAVPYASDFHNIVALPLFAESAETPKKDINWQ